MYPSYYCKHPCQTFEKAETHFFTMSTKSYTIDSDLKNEEAVKFFVCISPCQCHKNKNLFPFPELWR